MQERCSAKSNQFAKPLLPQCLDAESEVTVPGAFDVEVHVRKISLGLELLRETQRGDIFYPTQA